VLRLGYHRRVRPIRGPRHAADDERTVEAPPEEPTLSAGLDVREAFEAQDMTVPGAVVGLPPIEGPADVQDRTMPLVSPAIVLEIQAKAAPAFAPLPPPSDPVLMPSRRESEAEDDLPLEIPGASGAQRKRMQRIVFGVLGVCGLLCFAALARQLLAGNASASPAPSVAATSGATTSVAATTVTTAAATPSAEATPAAAANAAGTSAATAANADVPPPSTPAPVATEAPTPAPTPVAPATTAVATPLARAAAPDPPSRPGPAAPSSPARRQPPASSPPPHARSTGAAPAKPKATIVRDAPF